MSRCKLTIYDEPAKSGRCTCSEEREQGEEEHRKADGNAAAEVLGHRDVCFGIRVLVNLGLSRGRGARETLKGRQTEERKRKREPSATKKRGGGKGMRRRPGTGDMVLYER